VISKIITFAFLFSLSFTAAFAVNEYLQIYVVFSLLLIFYAFYNILLKKTFPKFISAPYFFCYIFLIYILFISIFINNEKTLIYLIVYLFFYLVLFISVSYLLLNIKIEIFLKLNSIAVLLISAFVFFEIFTFYYFNFDIHKYIPRIGPVPDATVLGTFRRAYGWSNEPTNLSGYFVVFGGLAIYYWILKRSILLYLRISLVIGALILTFSGSALGGIFVSLIIYPLLAMLYNKKNNSLKIFIYYSSIFILFYLISFLEPAQEVISKFKFTSEFGSGRGENWIEFYDLVISNNFMPHGLGSAGILGRFPVNSYLLILFEAGFFGLFFYTLFHLSPLFLIISNKSLPVFDKNFLIFIYIASLIQLFAYDTFYYPYTLIIIAVLLHVCKSGSPLNASLHNRR
jgi:hypothetical protein